MSRPFCPKGHDTTVTGRNSRGECNKCIADRHRERYKNEPGFRAKSLAASGRWHAKQAAIRKSKAVLNISDGGVT